MITVDYGGGGGGGGGLEKFQPPGTRSRSVLLCSNCTPSEFSSWTFCNVHFFTNT